MAKWHGKIGYSIPKQTTPGIWKPTDEVKTYSGDVTRNSNQWSANPESTNDELSINNQFSIVADPFAYQNFHSMKWIEFMGTRWKITKVEVQYPRLLLTIGGVWNG